MTRVELGDALGKKGLRGKGEADTEALRPEAHGLFKEGYAG